MRVEAEIAGPSIANVVVSQPWDTALELPAGWPAFLSWLHGTWMALDMLKFVQLLPQDSFKHPHDLEMTTIDNTVRSYIKKMPGPNPCLKVEHIWDARLREIRKRNFSIGNMNKELRMGSELPSVTMPWFTPKHSGNQKDICHTAHDRQDTDLQYLHATFWWKYFPIFMNLCLRNL